VVEDALLQFSATLGVVDDPYDLSESAWRRRNSSSYCATVSEERWAAWNTALRHLVASGDIAAQRTVATEAQRLATLEG
jgi:hypothetical protein